MNFGAPHFSSAVSLPGCRLFEMENRNKSTAASVRAAKERALTLAGLAEESSLGLFTGGDGQQGAVARDQMVIRQQRARSTIITC